MDARDLLAHKKSPKRLATMPHFKPLKKGKLPKPFKTMGGSRLFSTDIIDVSDTHSVIFIWRDGSELTDTMFLAWMLCKLNNGDFSPLYEFHFHPSHKGMHAKIPCRTQFNYTNRQLPGAPEFNLHSANIPDPRTACDRGILIVRFCKACGIDLGDEQNLWK